MKSGWRGAKRGIALVASCLIALSVVELALRTLLPPLPRVQRIVDDPLLGWDSEQSMVALNNRGGQAVYFLGDSFTQDRRWPALTQEQAESLGVPFDGYVLGVSGYGTTQSALKLERDFDRHRPRLVLLLFFAWNDLRDNVARPAIFYSPTTRTRPYLVAHDGTVTFEPAARLSPATWILYRTDVSRRFLLKAALRVSDRIARTDVDALARWHVPLLVNYTERGTWEPFYVKDRANHYVEDAYAATEAAFRRMRDFLAARGSQLAVIGIDNPFVVDDDVAQAWIRPELQFDADAPLRRVGEILGNMGVAFESATPALRDARTRFGKKMYNPPAGELSGHLEPEGEAVVAQLAARMAARLLRQGG
jgi:hypothetical protein